jgi:cyclic pyranopterin phosphate synthase
MSSHLDEQNRPRMVDVADKTATERHAHAQALIALPSEALDLIADHELHARKGPVFQTAILAGTMAVKRTSDLIPLCHPLPIEGCNITVELRDDGLVQVDCRVRTHYKTGVEMEALTGAGIAALTIYDMCKALSHDIVIRELRLVEKRGGKSDFLLHE